MRILYYEYGGCGHAVMLMLQEVKVRKAKGKSLNDTGIKRPAMADQSEHNESGNFDGDSSFYDDDFTTGGESNWTGADGTYLSGDDGSIPDTLLLNLYCAKAKAPQETQESKIEAEASWNPVRDWLASHNAEEVRAAVEQRGENGLTAIHFACRNVPPLDVIDVFLSIAADTVQWPDGFGWLPIHYACASGSDETVIKALAEQYPDSKTATDGRGRTPLHFALGDKPATPDVVFLLSSTGAASFPDDIGMLVSANECHISFIHLIEFQFMAHVFSLP